VLSTVVRKGLRVSSLSTTSDMLPAGNLGFRVLLPHIGYDVALVCEWQQGMYVSGSCPASPGLNRLITRRCAILTAAQPARVVDGRHHGSPSALHCFD